MYDYLYEEEGQDTSDFYPVFDREAIEKHFNLLHERAQGIDGLIPVVAITDGVIKVHQFPVGAPKKIRRKNHVL